MRRRTRQLSLKECYGILKIEKGADLEILKKAYRRRAFELHPDLNPKNPDAGRQFQLLNEAYVALLCLLKPADVFSAQDEAAQPDGGAKPASDGRDDARNEEQTRKSRTASTARDGGEKDPTSPDDAAAGEAGRKPDDGAGRETGKEQDGAGKEEAQSQSGKAGNAYEEQDVLRDLLNDPFARRVFEDIYSELGRQQADGQRESPRKSPEQIPLTRSGGPGKKSTKIHQSNLAWGTARWNMDFNRGVKGVVKDWLLRQIDEAQELRLPSGHLAPGRRIRLQIRQGFSDELRTVEITLPPDFAVGKPVRLRGLGKRIGPWQGDLYLTLYNE